MVTERRRQGLFKRQECITDWFGERRTKVAPPSSDLMYPFLVWTRCEFDRRQTGRRPRGRDRAKSQFHSKMQ
jgi:hypothetical protein